MTRSFSERQGYSRKVVTPVLDDAPDSVRRAYTRFLLRDFVHIDRDFRFNWHGRPLGAKDLYEELTSELFLGVDEDYSDSMRCMDILRYFISCEVEWNQFYDIVEHVGRVLLKLENSDRYESLTELESPPDFNEYRSQVNGVLEKGGVAWRLNDESLLETGSPAQLANLAIDVRNITQSQFGSAAQHVNKALKYLKKRDSLDPENAVKESVAAMESVGKSIWPQAKTFGDVAKCMRTAGYPNLLVVGMEKFYGYASSEPGVRHGGSAPPAVQLDDAEFCVYVALTFIRYVAHRMTGTPTEVDKGLRESS